MGHIDLARLSSGRRWKEVVRLLDERAPIDDVIMASAIAAERDLAAAATDPLLAEAVRLLSMVPQAARSAGFAGSLRSLGVEVPDAPMLGDLTVGLAGAFDRRAGMRSDFSEIVRRALVGTLSALVGDELPGLFGADAAAVRPAVARFGRPEAFSRLARAFFGRLLADTLGSWLDRTLSVEIGPGSRIRSYGERDRFDRGLDRYCGEATRIIREFSGAWYGRTLIREGAITTEQAAGFSAVAMKKIGAELRRKRNNA